MSVRYHEQLFSRQQKVDSMRLMLNETNKTLNEALNLLKKNNIKDIPQSILDSNIKLEAFLIKIDRESTD